ncbi:MAG TPA: polymer-forming cytoskeletal protein [Stellaceae bacterium]|nr:polymer-forming cytoskeletal protein [Stellaceae bacterium]
MSDAPDDLGIPMRPARPPGQPASIAPLGRTPAPVPPRTPEPMRPAAESARAEPPRRPAEPPVATPPLSPRREGDARSLIVGREISLSGEITSCDRLIVEGSVEANLQNSREMDIAESGLFKGTAAISEAEIRGRFEGNLTVRKRLYIRATGRVRGTIRYGQIEIECGGQISGDIQAQAHEDIISAVPAAD